jgi:hypothetical protein
MRIFLAAFAAVVLTGCSEEPAPVKKAELHPAPLSGRQAFQYLYGSSRMWAPDSQPLTVRSVNVTGVKPEPGKAGGWEIIFVSESLARARTYTWSAVEADGLHKGVFPGQQEAWRAGGNQRPFSPALLKADTVEAYEEAVKSAKDYVTKPGTRPPVNFMLEYEAGTRFPNPIWRVMWGGSVSSAEYTVTVDANTSKVVARD